MVEVNRNLVSSTSTSLWPCLDHFPAPPRIFPPPPGSSAVLPGIRFSYAGSALFLPALGWGLLLWALGAGKGPVLGLGVVSLPRISSNPLEVPGLQEPPTAAPKQSSLMTTSSFPQGFIPCQSTSRGGPPSFLSGGTQLPFEAVPGWAVLLQFGELPLGGRWGLARSRLEQNSPGLRITGSV